MNNYQRILASALLFVLLTKRNACQMDVGCFNDRRHEWAFFWWGPGNEFSKQSKTSCIEYCYNQRFVYAALGGLYGTDCHCGNSAYDIYGGSNQCSWCNERGEGFRCGRRGDDPARLIFVYKIVKEPPVTVDARHVGCWTSDHAPNVLDSHAMFITNLAVNNLTVDICINKCREASRIYAGLFNGKECWCGSDLQWQFSNRSPAHTAQCNIGCPGNDTELCGGDRFVSIYRTVCIDGTYGLSGKACQPCLCANDTVCDKSTGKCSGLCIPGYSQQSPSGPCAECPDNFYGEHCNISCNCQAQCDKATGECTGPCVAGWMKSLAGGPCSIECQNGYYGEGCQLSCNCQKNCNKTSGQCFGDCTEGWTRSKEGEPCSVSLTSTTSTTSPSTTPAGTGTEGRSTSDRSSKSIGLGVGLGAAAILILAILFIVFMCKRRKNKGQNTSLIPDDIAPSTRVSVLAVDNFEAIDTDPEGNNTLYPVANLMEVMQKRSEEEKPFYDEFQNLPKGNLKDWDFAESHQLREVKNRFGNVFPYNENRVILKSANENDYINASFIKNYAGEIGYIAAQGPILSTVDDFLQMVWQENVSNIVMVTNLIEEGKEKCEQYWPKEDGSTDTNREITWKKTNEFVFPDYIVRTFTMSKGTESRQLKHYMFSGWSDHEGLTYASSILNMLEMVKNDPVETEVISDKHSKELPNEDASIMKEAEAQDNKNENEDQSEDPYNNAPVVITNEEKKEKPGTEAEGPWLVHCSAGVGRTGTFIALDYLLEQAEAEGQIDVFECIYKLREQRINMVQSLDQYRFIYIALLKALVIGSTSIPCYNFEDTLQQLQEPDPETHKSNLYIQYEALEVLKPKHKKTEFTDALKPENKSKNRSEDFLPTNRFRPTFATNYKGTTGYINAVAVKGYKTKFAFLATQLPLENTRQDFWCMVCDYRCPVIVSLQCPEEEVYWPQTENKSISYGEFTVQCLSKQRVEAINLNKMTLAVRHKESDPTTTVLLQVDWPRDISLLTPEHFFIINDMIIAHQHGNSTYPVVIQCMHGYTRSGLVCGLNCLIDMINAEQQADVFQCVQHIRSTRPEFIHSFEQFKFLYNTTVKYISTMDSYANFKKL